MRPLPNYFGHFLPVQTVSFPCSTVGALELNNPPNSSQLAVDVRCSMLTHMNGSTQQASSTEATTYYRVLHKNNPFDFCYVDNFDGQSTDLMDCK